MKRILLGFAVVLAALATVGCGGGSTGPIKIDTPDFYSPVIGGVSFSPTPPVAGSDVTLVASVTDNGGNARIVLRHRRIGDTDYAEVGPTNSLSGTNTFVIPGAQVASPGIEYYFVATDGTNMTAEPASAPGTVFSILINYVSVAHNAVVEARSGSDLLIAATLTSDTAIDQTKSGFRYRAVGAPAFAEVLFGTKNGDNYNGTLPGAALIDGTNYEYYIFAESAGGATRQFPENAAAAGTYLRFLASSSVNNKPIAIPTGPTTGTVGQEIRLSGNYNDDGPGPYSYIWSKGAGTSLDLSTYSDAQTSLKPLQTGTYTYNLAVSDGRLQSDPVPITITVTSPTLTGTLPSLTLYAASSPYVVLGDITVPAGETLKIERGVTLRFRSNTGLYVNGTLDASGSADANIIFTSDTTIPIKGFWKGIYLSNTPRLPHSTINFCTVSYSRDGIELRNADSPTISECKITLNENRGIYVDNSTVTINKCDLFDNGTDGVYCVNNSTATLSSNIIKKNSRNGVYCEGSRIEMAKNEVSENKYGAFVVACRGANVVNIYGNKFFANADGIRIQDADPVVQSNDIYANKDNGIIAYSLDPAETGAGRFTSPNISSNAIHNNRDDGIHLEDCYPPARRTHDDNRHQFSEIYSNVISFSGGEAIECKGSSPIINRNIIGMSSDNGVLCITGAAPLSRPSSPFLKNNSIVTSSRAAIAVIGDAINPGETNAPEAWWNNFYGNNLVWIDLKNGPGTDLGVTVGIDLGPAPTVSAMLQGNASVAAQLGVVTDNSYATGGRTYYKFLGGAVPSTGDRFGWNLNEDPLWEQGGVNSAKWEDPFLVTWAMRSELANPRNSVGNSVSFKQNDPTSKLINSGEPVFLIDDSVATVAPDDPLTGLLPGSVINNVADFLQFPTGTYLRDGSAANRFLLNILDPIKTLPPIRYANYQNSDISLGKWTGAVWPTK